MAEHFTRPNIEKVVGKLGTTPEQRGLSTQEFKDKFDEMPEAIQQYIKETLLAELDAFKEEFMTHQAENVVYSGSNENGHYIKFGNGVMICFAQVAINRSSDYLSQEQCFDFPQPFVSVPAVSLSHTLGININYQESCATVFMAASNIQWVFAITKSTNVGSTLAAYAIAIGRWK